MSISKFEEKTNPRFLEEYISDIVEWFDGNSNPLLKISISELEEPINVITVEQLVNFLDLRKFHRRDFHYPSYAEIMNQVENFNLGPTRMLTREQFIYMLLEWASIPNIKHELLLAFQALDSEKRTFLDVNELKQIVTTFGDVLNENEAIELLRDADVKGDGYIFYADFIESLFKRFPELHKLQTEFLYEDPREDPSIPPLPSIPKKVKSAHASTSSTKRPKNKNKMDKKRK